VPTGLEQDAELEAYTWKAIFLPKGASADSSKKLNDRRGGGDEDARRLKERPLREGSAPFDRLRWTLYAGIPRPGSLKSEIEKVGGADSKRAAFPFRDA